MALTPKLSPLKLLCVSEAFSTPAVMRGKRKNSEAGTEVGLKRGRGTRDGSEPAMVHRDHHAIR